MTETPRALTCPNCGGTIALRAAGVSVTLVCEHCGSALDATREDVRLIAAAASAMRQPEIALGTRGTVRGTQWEVVGYLERADAWVEWCEYLLFNPYEGYAFLVDDGRRYSLGRLLDRVPGSVWRGVMLDDAVFSRFGDPYDVRVTFVVGEFYWRVAVGETVKATDYVRPGTMVSCEEDGRERTWTRLEMLDRGEAERAFGIGRRFTGPGGTPSPHERSPYGVLLLQAVVVAFVALVAMLLMSMGGSGRERLVSQRIEAPMDAGSRSTVIGPITLAQRYNRVTIGADAMALDNAWVDLDYALVDRRTQDSFDSWATAERYSGRDSEGPWSEGDTTPHVSLASIPAGTYDLVVEAGAKRWTNTIDVSIWGPPTPSGSETVPVDISVEAGGIFGSNFVLAMLVILIWPAMLLAFHLNFEARRKAPLAE